MIVAWLYRAVIRMVFIYINMGTKMVTLMFSSKQGFVDDVGDYVGVDDVKILVVGSYNDN